MKYQHVIGIITGYDSHFEESRDYITQKYTVHINRARGLIPLASL